MAAPIPVPLTGPFDINDIKKAFPSTNKNNLGGYVGKDWYKPSDGSTGTFTRPIKDSDFRGKMEAYSFHITADTYNIDLLTEYTNRGLPYTKGKTAIICYVDSGVKVGSTSASSASFIIQNLTASDAVTLINNGLIIGCGGNGSDSGGGGNGGTALQISYPTKVVNNGTLAGGGGGGGGGAPGHHYVGWACSEQWYNGGSGGGGAGFNPGAVGGATTYTGGSPTTAGDNTTGGYGGNLGQNGNPSYYGGGTRGSYIVGSANITGGIGSVGGTKIGSYS